MYDELLTQSTEFYKKHIRRRRWLRVLCILSAIVVFVTTYALILPGITKERQSFCGMPEHSHTDTCYKQCEPELVCELPEIVQHIHDRSCYDAESGELICTARQYELHTHTDTCYADDGILICEQKELCEHLHSNDCYNISTEEVELICGLSEHIHIDECYIDLNADLEDASVWEATLPELTGNWSEDLVAIARSQLGYSESETNIVIGSDMTRGYTRYGQWADDPHGDWARYFFDFCLSYTDIDTSFFPITENITEWKEHLTEAGYYHTVSTYEPKSGDLVFFADGRVEIVAEYDTCIRTIEGDINGSVGYVEYETDTNIIGYADLTSAYNDYLKVKPIEQVFTDTTLTVKATYTGAADIPDGAVLTVKEIPSGERHDQRYNEACDVIDSATSQTEEANITSFRLYDICFVYEGSEIQPNDKVKIEMTLNDITTAVDNEVSVIHFADEGTEIPLLTQCDVGEELTVGFSVESFSEFAIVTSTSNTLEYVSMTKNTSGTLSTANPYAIVSGDRALLMAADGQGQPVLTACAVYPHDIGGNLTVDKRAQQWTLVTASGGNYLSASIGSQTLYLTVNAGVLSFIDNINDATVFARTWNNGALTLSAQGNYVDPASDRLISTSSVTLALYSAPTSGTFDVIFDAAIGQPVYMSSTNKKYNGAGYKVVSVGVGKTVVLPHNDPTSPDTENFISISASNDYTFNDWYELNGWYDVINRVFYDRTMLGKPITVTGSTIFYPEYISKNYNCGHDNGRVIKDQPDTRDFINTYMFDYNEIFNVDKSYVTEFGKDSSGRYITKWKVDTNDPSGMVFFDYIGKWVNAADDAKGDGNLGYMIGRVNADPNGVTVNEEKTAGQRGSDTTFPGTITPNILGPLGSSNENNPRLDALFTKETIPGRVYLGEGDWFYNFDETIGFYYYNSAANAASYNREDQRFYVYDYPVRIDNNNSMHDFTPFNYRDPSDGGTNADDGSPLMREKDNEINYWVGMQSDIEFFLPADTPTGNQGRVDLNVSSHGEDLQFRFSGDDDVWIFIDGKLVLDLGGVHDVVYGEINFATGKIKTGQAFSGDAVADNASQTYTEMPGLSTTNNTGVTTYDLPKLEGGQYHTVTVYYLERGSSLSNCAIYFNISPFYELELLKRDSTSGVGLEGAEFTVYSDPECTQPAHLYKRTENGEIVDAPSYFVTNEDGIARCEGLSAGATYYIKETKPPGNYPDMSMYVIAANLAHPGEHVTVKIDSNGKTWNFADEYVFADDSSHRIEINVYNDLFVGGDKEIYVRKQWAQGSSPEPVVLQLYANGQPTDRTVELSADCNWEATLMSLPEKDGQGNEIKYSFKEIQGPSNYSVTYEESEGTTSETVTVPGRWEPATGFTVGKTYRIIHNNNRAMATADNNYLVTHTGPDTENISHWEAVRSGNGIALKNLYYGNKYLHITDSYTCTHAGNLGDNNRITFHRTSGNMGRISATFNRQTYYIIGYDEGYGVTNNANNGSQFALYEWIPPSQTVVEGKKPGWLITNTPWPTSTSVPITKEWDATVTHPPDSIGFSLYLVTEGQESLPELVADLTLTKANGWQGVFEDIAYPDNGKYYVVIENTEDYTATFNSETASIYVNGKFVEGSRVEFDSGGSAATVSITNSALILLPSTGGKGTTHLYTIGGILLMTTAVILLVYNSRKRRLEDSGTP